MRWGYPPRNQHPLTKDKPIPIDGGGFGLQFFFRVVRCCYCGVRDKWSAFRGFDCCCGVGIRNEETRAYRGLKENIENYINMIVIIVTSSEISNSHFSNTNCWFRSKPFF